MAGAQNRRDDGETKLRQAAYNGRIPRRPTPPPGCRMMITLARNGSSVAGPFVFGLAPALPLITAQRRLLRPSGFELSSLGRHAGGRLPSLMEAGEWGECDRHGWRDAPRKPRFLRMGIVRGVAKARA